MLIQAYEFSGALSIMLVFHGTAVYMSDSGSKEKDGSFS